MRSAGGSGEGSDIASPSEYVHTPLKKEEIETPPDPLGAGIDP